MKRCECGNEQWEWWWPPGQDDPIVICEVCETEYNLHELIDAYLRQTTDKGLRAEKSTIHISYPKCPEQATNSMVLPGLLSILVKAGWGSMEKAAG